MEFKKKKKKVLIQYITSFPFLVTWMYVQRISPIVVPSIHYN